MFKWFSRLGLVAAMLIGFSGVALAQDGEVEEKFYNFDDMLIDGDFQDPSGQHESAREQANFNRMQSLRRSFLPDI